MKILKRILIIVVIIIAIPLIIALFVKKDYSVEREVVVNKPKQQVFDYVKFIKNQDNFSKWNMADPAMKKDYVGSDGIVGFIYKWESQKKEVGQGEQEIAKITEGDRIDMNLHFYKPFEAKSTAYMITTAVTETQTKVKWGFNGHMDYPMNFMCVFMNMDKMIGDDLSTGLTNLKGVLEK